MASGPPGARSRASSTWTSRSTPATSPRSCGRSRTGADVATVRRIYAFQLRSLDRYFMSRGYSWLVRRLLGVPLRDTETGYKFFRRERLLPVLDEIQDPGWFWDTEFMVRAERRGLRIDEIPGAYVRRDDKTSTVRGLRDSVRYFAQAPRASAGSLRRSGGVKALGEIGWRAGRRASASSPWPWSPTASPSSPSCAAPSLRLLGARIGRRTILHDVRFFNLYRRGLAGLVIGDECFLGDECLLDLAEGIELERPGHARRAGARPHPH